MRFDSLGWHFIVKVPPREIIFNRPVCLPLGSEVLPHDSGAVFFWFNDSYLNVLIILCLERHLFLQYCVHVTVLSALRHGKLSLSSLTVLWRRTWRRGLWNSLYSSPGDSSMHVRAFIMLLLWSKKEYGLLKSNLWLLGLRSFSNNGLNFSFNCLFTSNILWVQNDTLQKIIKVGFMLSTCRLLLGKGAFHSIRNSEISFVLRIKEEW